VSRAVAIFGSCVTRDAFELQSRTSSAPVRIGPYLSRTTINSCLSAPITSLAVPPPGDTIGFEERCARADLAKTHFQELRGQDFDYLVIDLIDERHWLIDIGGAEAAYSIALLRFLEQQGVDEAQFARTRQNNPKIIARTMANIPVFLNRLAASVDPARVILHEARWARRYVATDGAVHDFEPLKPIDETNEILDRYHAAIRKAWPALRTIRVPDELLLADAGHRWKLEPFHYAEAYYVEFLRQLDAIAPVAMAEAASA
jgi:hypothetical protein